MKGNQNKNAKQKQRKNENVFVLFEFYKRKISTRPRKLSKFQAKQLWISCKNFKNASNLIVLLSSKIHVSTRKTRNSIIQLRRIAHPCSNQKLQRTKNDPSQLATRPSQKKTRKLTKRRQKLRHKAKHKGRQEYLSRSSLFWLSKTTKNPKKRSRYSNQKCKHQKSKICQMT